MTSSTLAVVDSLTGITRDEWNALGDGNPFVSLEFLDLLQTSGCASRRTGWQPRYVLLRHGERLAGAMPLYLKSHSRGEYVFDHAWANAFEQHGIPYYPKLLSAVPFTPVGGPRLLAATHADRVLLARGAIEVARRFDVSSLHVLFPNQADLEALRECGFMLREGVQFHWVNRGYDSFDAFLATMNHDKRKKMRQDRKKVREAGVTYRWVRGADITAADLAFFYRCYESTYASHWSSPYLTPEFFRDLHASRADLILLVIAERAGVPLACALNIIGANVMYGRYWGALDFVSGLHFETCYSQGIEYCIAHGLESFEGGAQGVHKMSRGLLPTPTWSAHWIADARFAAAIGNFLTEETASMDGYLEDLEAHSPFKQA